MNSPGTIADKIILSDCRFNPPEFRDWTEEEKRHAMEKLRDSIIEGAVWDENAHYRLDLLFDIESILVDREDDKLSRIKDVRYMYAERYAMDEVANDPTRYCESEDEF